MKIVILGYTGLIGKSIVEHLIKDTSLFLVCVGRNVEYKPYINSNIKYFEWDFVSFNESNLIFLKKADIIINCVGKTAGQINNLENINVIFIKKFLRYINNKKSKIRFVHLSSVAVYGVEKNNLNNNKLVSENSKIDVKNLYSKSKLKADLIIQNNKNKNFSYTILRISNVFGEKNKTNLFKFVLFSLKFGFWIKCSNDIMFNFINVKDVAQSIILTITKLKHSKNKTFIVSDDCKQYQIYNKYQKFYKKKVFKIQVSSYLIKFLINFFPLPKKIINFMLLISTRTSYSNNKIKNELNFKPKFSLTKKIKILNE